MSSGSNWQDALDPALAARLRAPAERPGVIPMDVVRRVFGWLRYLQDRIQLANEIMRRRVSAGGLAVERTPIVHAQWVQDVGPRPDPAAEMVREREVRTIERTVVRAIVAARQAGVTSAATASRGKSERVVESDFEH